MKKFWIGLAIATVLVIAGYFTYQETSKPKLSAQSSAEKDPPVATQDHNAPALAPGFDAARDKKAIDRGAASLAENKAPETPPKVSDYFFQRVPASLRTRSVVVMDEKSQWRMLAKLTIDGIRVEDSDVNMEPRSGDDFFVYSGQIPTLPDSFPSFPPAKADDAIVSLRNVYEKRGFHVQNIDFFDKSWIIHSDQSVTPCMNIDVEREGRTHEHEVVCVHAQTGEIVSSRSVIRKF